MSSALENLFAMQLDAAGLTGYVREYQAIPGRCGKFTRRIVMTHICGTCENFSERKEAKNE